MQKSLRRREFNRLKFNEPIRASMKLVSDPLKNIDLSSDEHPIYVIDMSASGLRFVSKTEFKVNFLTIYKFELRLNDRDLTLYGKIIRKAKLIDDFKEYGVKFNFNYDHYKDYGIILFS